MENQTFEKDRLVFLGQCKYLFQNNMYADVLALAEERLKRSPLDVDAYAAVGEALIAMDLMNEANELLNDVEKKISDLSFVFARMGESYAEKGHEKAAQLCYQKFKAFNSATKSFQGLDHQTAITDNAKIIDNQTNQSDNVPASDHRIKILKGWLINIHRIKTHATSIN